MFSIQIPTVLLALALLQSDTNVSAAEVPAGDDGFSKHVQPFFEANCVDCHGPKKSKGKVTLHTLDGDLSAGADLERWETILEMLKSGEMPPEDEPQPSPADRAAIIKWIDDGLREPSKKAGEVAIAPTVRRMTNFEYENTLRDLLGFELKLIDDLPNDPVKPYKFNNTAELMRMGPEQIDRYLEASRRAMASAIVDPGDPKVYRSAKTLSGKAGEKGVEIGVYGGFGTYKATTLTEWPKTGEFKIRVKASAVLPPDHRKSAFDVSWEREAPRILLESIEFEAPVADVWPPEHHTRILFDSPLRKTEPMAYVREVLKRFMSRAYRRPVLPDELDRFVRIYNALGW